MTATHIQDVKYANRACAKNINRNRLLPVFSFIFQFHCWTASIQWMLNIVTNWENNHTINSCDYVRAISVFQLNFERLRFEWIWPSTLECHVLENGHWISHLLRRSSNFHSLLFFCCCFPWIWFNVQIWVGTLAIFIVSNRFCWCDFGARARQTILWYWISKCITQIYRNIYKFNNFYELVFWIKWLLLLFSKTRRKKRLRTTEREKPSALCVIETEKKKMEKIEATA